MTCLRFWRSPLPSFPSVRSVPPLQGPAGIHLLMVCERRGKGDETPAIDLATEEERERLTKELERERLDRLARRYLRDLRKQAFIDIRI